ncbi:MAG TPA: hypothetical protein VFN31_00935 [Candidatus Saccharimonadales bacterium]|nr:hypothetical protein [Candidatus Saccharimonadales bacterium]
MKNNGKWNLSEAYDSRVAYPLIIIAALSLLFVSMNSHKSVPLKNSANVSSSRKVLSKEPNTSVTAPQLPSLSQTVKTEDVTPGESPLDIQTATPQDSGSADVASPGSGKQLQNTPSSSPVNSDQPSNADTQNLINGLSNTVIDVPKPVDKIGSPN